MTLTAAQHRYPSALELIEDYHRRGWTDGLPIVPPTPELVEEFLAAATLFLEALYDELATMADLAGRELVQKESVYAIPGADDWARVTAGATVGVTGFGG